MPLPSRSVRRARFARGGLRLALISIVLLWISATIWAQAQPTVVEDIRIHGNRRIPANTIRARMFTRPGDVYDAAGVERDFNALWNSGYFDDLRFEREEGAKGLILHVYVKEKPTIREIKYLGLSAVTQSEVLEKFKELKVGLTQESPFDPTRVKRAEVVLKEILAAHGHKFATITTEIRQIPPAAVSITFNIKEGPKVKVGKIKFEGNKKVSSKYLRSAMKNLKPIGIPHSIILENLFSRTYDATKLSEDAERVRLAYQDKGYFKAIVEDPRTRVRDVTGVAWYFPFWPRRVKLVDITIPVEEGDRYKLKEITFSGNKALSNTATLRRLFKTRDGEWFSRAEISKGLEELRKAYSTLGYINETNIPNTEVDEANKTITLRIDVDEGKQFFVRRIEFSGNTTTRDKVIRRELALEEGQVYNSSLWEVSLLRLNQLNYFEALRPEQDSEVHQNVAESTVDINLKVKEKGKNSLGLNGGVSGLAGAFVGVTYETNNFLGLGETLSVAASIGNFQRNYMFGFTEPYLFDKPIQAGLTAYWRTFRYNQAQQAGINPQIVQGSTFFSALQNFSQESKGFTLSSSYAVRRSFKRFGLTYSYDNSDLSPGSSSSAAMLAGLAFRTDVNTVCPTTPGPVSPLNPITLFPRCPYLQGIVTSKLVPSFSMNTIDSPLRPHSGRSYFVGMDIAGVGGNVSYIRPIAEYKQFWPMKGLRRNPFGNQTFGVRVQGSFITGFGGKTAPPYERFFQGGDTDLRGFDVRSISPAAFIPDQATLTLLNPDGTPVLFNPENPRQGPYTVTVPINRLVYPGGDTSIVANVEYRIPIAGPLVFALFVDAGMDMAVLDSQLRLSNALLGSLNTQPFGCPAPNAAFTGCEGTQTLAFPRSIRPVDGTNYALRMSTGVEMQIMLPMINAPFRLYYAYNPFRVNTRTPNSALVTRDMFPEGGAGDFTFLNAQSAFPPVFILREPRKTFRLTVATTF